ncbi:MAG: ComF family protein [Litorivivens sp.]|jgi:ComF family protein
MHFSALPALIMSCVPSQCAVCRSWPSTPVCHDCMVRFGQPRRRCRTCALELPAASPTTQCSRCLRHPFGLDACFAGLAYAFPWSELVSRYKFDSQTGWAAFMASTLLAQPSVRDFFSQLTPDDRLLPLPLSAERLAWRGFNQAWELTRALQRQSACRAIADASLLLRTRHTRPQSELKRSARLDNLKGAFAVEPLRAAELTGRRVVLIDDVMTSGASLLTAASVLRQAGAIHVSAVVLTRTAPT